jgi:hypothetical protein
VFKFINFRFCLFSLPLGDFQVPSSSLGILDVNRHGCSSPSLGLISGISFSHDKLPLSCRPVENGSGIFLVGSGLVLGPSVGQVGVRGWTPMVTVLHVL